MPAVADDTTLKLAADQLVRCDPVLAPIIERSSLATISPHKNYYQELVESIISQQLSVKAAATILRRFVGLFPGDDFPGPELIFKKDIEQLRLAGLSRQKGCYIQDLASKVIDGRVRFDHLDELSNEQIIAELTLIKGVGEWTVHMFLIFCMGRLDVLPVGDLGIKNGIQRLYGFDSPPTPADIRQTAIENSWHPYESVASWYVWNSIDAKPAL